MNDQDMQAQFIQWLAEKTGATTEDELKQVIQKAQSEGSMQDLVSQFQSEIGGNSGSATQSFAKGGKLSYIECLKQMKKGGKMDCGCGKKVPKGQAGLLASVGQASTKLAGLAKPAAKTLSFGQKALKFGMDNKNKIQDTIQGGLNLAKNAKGLNTASKVVTPSPKNNFYGANAGAIESPQMKTMQRQVPVFTGNDIPYGGITATNPLAKRFEKGGILFADKGARLERKEGRQERRAERQIDRRNKNLVNEFNYQGTETAPGVFTRARSRFDEGAEAILKARKPVTPIPAGATMELQNQLFSEDINRNRMSGWSVPPDPRGTIKQAPINYDEKEVFEAATDKVFPTKKAPVVPVAKAKTAQVNPANIKGKTPSPNAIGNSPVAKQIRVPNLQYPGSTTIMPGNEIGEVEASAPSIVKRAEIIPKPNTALPINPKHAEAVKVWANNYAKAKAIGDKIGMMHWQNLLETAGGEGRPKR